MTLEKAHELIDIHVSLGGGYNRNVTRMVLKEITRDHGEDAANTLIREFSLDTKWQLMPGTNNKSAH